MNKIRSRASRGPGKGGRAGRGGGSGTGGRAVRGMGQGVWQGGTRYGRVCANGLDCGAVDRQFSIAMDGAGRGGAGRVYQDRKGGPERSRVL